MGPAAAGAAREARDALAVAATDAAVRVVTYDDAQPGLLYFNLIPAGIVSLGAEPNPTVCTITAI